MRTCITLGIAALFLLVCASTTIFALYSEENLLLTDEFIHQVNRLNGGLWTAGYTNRTRRMTRHEAKRLMGTIIQATSGLPPRRFSEEELREPLPESFEASEKWPNCPTITEIRDQSGCGSSWAVVAASSMSDRHCTIGGVRDLRISAGDLLSCCERCGFGCKGGYPAMAWRHYVQSGIVSEYCQPYPFPPCAHHVDSSHYPSCASIDYKTPNCNATCTDEEIPLIRYKGRTSYSLRGEEDFMRELFLRGPFDVAFTVYEDFVAYMCGVYKHVSGSALGGHAARLVGWGKMNGVKYWKMANTWNDEWGMNGYFLIVRGDNECGIEGRGIAGTPEVPLHQEKSRSGINLT